MVTILQLSPAEVDFLRAWIWEEANFDRPHTPRTKTTQIDNAPYSAPLLADIVAASMPADVQVNIAAGSEPKTNPPWPWASDADLVARHQEARAWLANRFPERPSKSARP